LNKGLQDQFETVKKTVSGVAGSLQDEMGITSLSSMMAEELDGFKNRDIEADFSKNLLSGNQIYSQDFEMTSLQNKLDEVANILMNYLPHLEDDRTVLIDSEELGLGSFNSL
jgi:hypothetical protein